jgi:hypothetical protein
MAAITSATYTINYKRRLGDSKVMNNVTLVFGNGSATYATGGFALAGGSMGCPNNIESITFESVISGATASGYIASWNKSSGSIIMLRTGATAGVLVEANGDAMAAQTVVCDVIGW